jgi:hypothetical protein
LTENLPANISELSQAELMRLSGQAQEDEFNIGLPRLRVNYDDEDDDKNKIPRGQWALAHEGDIVFSENVEFRIYYSTYQYSHYDPEQGKTIARSIHFQSFRDEIPDDTGGMKCGKVPKKLLEELSDAEKDFQKQIKCARVLFGTVSISGTNRKGIASELKDIPCMFYARGTNFMPMSDYLKELQKRNILMSTVKTNISLNRKKNGGVVYWEGVPVMGDTVKLAPEDYKLLMDFSETVKAENAMVIEKWKKNRRKNGGDNSMQKVASNVASGLDDNIDDLISGQSDDMTLLGAG